MYFKYDKEKEISVPYPYSRVMTPYMTTDTASGEIPFSIHMAQWEPGAEVDEHSHEDATEAMYCLSGNGKASIGDEVFDLVQDSMICALPKERHWIKNTGTEKLKVLCIFTPPTSAASLRKRAEDAYANYLKTGKK